ncbi:hypothetical protein RM531_05120 [Salinisphaera sp. P385]|uniref:Uncharacterized protein n=1 Tax=Spectribacter acetivorans TaxID=3075603 RepID=A0ABU3B5X2_9GAMM|nr:hypothetical protein [Salinisphaera sp. P385]MDT0617844.1 hypothetical protein [Salinisphaera sp. P385]
MTRSSSRLLGRLTLAGLTVAATAATPLFAVEEIPPPRANADQLDTADTDDHTPRFGDGRAPRSKHGDYDGYKDAEEYCAHNLSQ